MWGKRGKVQAQRDSSDGTALGEETRTTRVTGAAVEPVHYFTEADVNVSQMSRYLKTFVDQ